MANIKDTTFDGSSDFVSDDLYTGGGENAAANGTVPNKTKSAVMLKVNFCVIVPSNFIESPSTELQIQFEGKINRKEKETSRIQNVEGAFFVTFHVLFSEEEISEQVSYYYMSVTDKQCAVKDKHQNEVKKRNITFEKKSLSEEVWWQYDGVLNLIDSTFFERVFFSAESEVRTSVRHFFPKWKYFYSHCSLDEPASLIMKRISMLYQGLLKNYYTAGKKWKNEKQFKEFIGKLFLDELKRTLEELIEFPQILHATAIILLDKEFNIPFHETQQNGLMRCLVLDVQKEEKKSQKYNDLINHFCDVLQDIPKALLCFIKSEKMASNSMWLCCLPLLHFLSGKCQPFDDITENADHSSRQPHWWGIEDVQDKVSKLKSSTWNIRAESLLDKLKPMFPMDFYLPRSFVAVLDYKDFDVLRSKKINPEVLLAGLIFHFKTGEIDRIKGQKTMLSKELLITVEEQLIEYSGHSNIPSQNLLESCYLTMKIAEDLLSVVLVRRDNSLKARAVKTLVTALAVYETVLGQKEKTTKSKEHIKILSGNTGHILNWLKEFQTSRNDKETLQTWDILFQKELPAGSVKSTVQSLLKEQIKDFLEEKLPFKKKNIVDIYLDGPQIFSAFMREILDDFVSKVLETNIDLFKGTHRNEIYKLLLKQFEDKWRKLNATKDQLELMLTWKPFPYCFGVYCEKRKAKEPSLDAAAEVLKRLYKELQNAEIRVWTLNLLQTYEDEACNLIRNLLNSVDINFTELLTSRKNELRAFDEIKRRAGLFIDLCQHFEVDLSTLETKMNAVVSEKIQEKKIRELCVFSGQAPQSVQVAFDVPQLLIAILSDIEKACKGNVFMKKWIRMGKEKAVSKGKPLTMEEAISTFHKVQKECKEISEKIISGYITFSEFEDLFGSFENEKDILREQLENLCYHTIYPGLIKERMDQFQQYRIIERCRAGADVLLRIRQDFHLKGNFHQIEEIAFMVRSGKAKQMRELDRSLITSCRILEDITDEKLESLEKFVNCKELINWIKRHIKGSTDLDSFLQLAYVEAGEGDADKSKVYCLRDAIIGYQHLIFNLQTNSDYAWLLKLCEELWKEIKTDKDLPEKLCFAKRHLEWYASVNEKQQRSVQSTTLEQVTNINSSGVYYVGKIMETDHRRTPTLEQVLELRVRHGDTQKTYRYSDLQDLQSKLMLVTGEESSQSDAVQKFTNVFEAVVRLSKLYIRLLSSGCVLFDIWKSRFLCDPERQACVFVQFGKCEFKGKTSPSEDVSTIIPRLCSYMESCLDQWIKYVDEKRCKYHELNSFTIGQIVIMQREIAKFDSNKHSKDLYQLLSITKQDCSRCNIFEALREVLFEIDQTEVKSPYDEKKERIEEEPKAVREESKETSFLTSMKNEGISETLARAALRSGISTDDIDEGLAWCAMNADKAVKIEESEVKRMPQSGFEEWVPNQQSISTKTLAIFHDVQCEGETEIHRLLAKMEKIWDKYLSSVSFSASDFLSLEHLGLLLRKLARKESNSILRKLHYGLRKGVPNLVVCPKVDLLKTVLTIYTFDQSQPFPQPDEILYCSEMTTLEEVEIFWRRAFCKDSGKIFCIVNADILDYDVSDKAESSLEKHLQLRKNDKIDYSLVVVCSTEREQSSRICAALDKYRRNCFSSPNKEKICLYVETKLRTTLQQKLVRPQKAKRFAEMSLESSATVVKSTENGNGKSLYIERRENDLKSKRIICNTISIPLFEKRINVDDVMENLLKHVLVPEKKEPRMIHIDLTPEVIEGVDYLIFHIIILGCLKNSTGLVWRKLDCDLYMIETTAKQTNENESLDLLPSMTCCSPIESLQIVERSSKVTQCQMFDLNIIRTEVFQRPFHYLLKHQNVKEGADASKREVSPKQCVETVLKQCGIRNPSWATLTHFVKFLNTQLADFEQSDFLKQELSSDLPGFSEFVLNFLIQMSRDFALPSIKISDETLYQMKRSTSFNQDDSEIEQYTLRRTWENSHHDFLFFNPDHNTMTFLGFEVEDEKNIRKSPRSEDLLGRKTMRKDLYDALIFNRVDLNEDYDSLPRDQKISKLCQVMGLEIVFDPDPTYELTKDNAKKILAIFMRFRSGIPVIVMGETGCGKTRLIKFMCSLQSPEGEDNQFENLMLMKVHSGVRKTDIVEMVKKQKT